ncbi:MAG: hypothetical protein LBK06_06240 [Planctomycetaceae bacterium]|jgi:hypothetical protein|nr:hypothetical protein [Planctomycetaceae bacterium]
MIQEQISTSSQRCLDGNSGFGVVAQTSGMAPNVSREVGMLSGYSHCFSAGDVRNPVVFLHVIRRTGGMDRHIVSRVADCGNDYSGRTNRIAHHLIIEDLDLQKLPCGPAAILSKTDLFLTQWKEKSTELPTKQTLPNPVISVQKCFAWEQFCGDAGWGGVVAERVERGDPVSLIFEPDKNILPLIDEVFTLLPSAVRWKTTFSTFFMKSQEPPSTNKIQIKCIVANSDEMMFARLTSNTFLVDLRKKLNGAPSGKYVDIARTGATRSSTPSTTPIVIQSQTANKIDTPDNDNLTETLAATNNNNETYETVAQPVSVPTQQHRIFVTENANEKFVFDKIWLNVIPIVILLILILGGGLTFMLYALTGQDKPTIEPNHNETNSKILSAGENEQEHNAARIKIEAEKAERKRRETEAKAEAERIEQRQNEVEARTEADKVEAVKSEQTQKEIEAKAEAERQQNEIKELELKFTKLPDGWEGLGLPFLSGSNVAVLRNSKFLADSDVKNRVKISYIPFVDLDQKTEKAILTINKIENADNIEFWYAEGKDVNGRSIKRTIAKIELKDDGLNFKFDDQLRGHKTDTDMIRQLNRILLAKLRIEIVGMSIKKELALYTPVRVNNIDTKKFTLWGEGNGKEYVLFQNDNKMLLYFDIANFRTIQNSKEQIQLTRPKKIVHLQNPSGFMQEVIYNGEKGTGKVVTLDPKTLALELNFFAHSSEKISNKYNELSKQILDKNKSRIEIERKKKDAEKFLSNQPIERDTFDFTRERIRGTNTPRQEKIIFKEQHDDEIPIDKKLNPKISETEKEIKDYNDRLNKIDDEIKNLQTEKQKVENWINENKTWNNIRLEEFSLHLLNPNTTADKVDNKENQLLLLEVKP